MQCESIVQENLEPQACPHSRPVFSPSRRLHTSESTIYMPCVLANVDAFAVALREAVSRPLQTYPAARRPLRVRANEEILFARQNSVHPLDKLGSGTSLEFSLMSCSAKLDYRGFPA